MKPKKSWNAAESNKPLEGAPKPDHEFGSNTWWVNAPMHQRLTLIAALLVDESIDLDKAKDAYKNMLVDLSWVPSFIPLSLFDREAYENSVTS